MVPEYFLPPCSHQDAVHDIQSFPPCLRDIQSHAPSMAFEPFPVPWGPVHQVFTVPADDSFTEHVHAKPILEGRGGEIQRGKR